MAPSNPDSVALTELLAELWLLKNRWEADLERAVDKQTAKLAQDEYPCLSPKQRWLLDHVAKGSIEYEAIHKDEILRRCCVFEYGKAELELFSSMDPEENVLEAWLRVCKIVKAQFLVKFDDNGGLGPFFEDRLADYCYSWKFGDFEPNSFSCEITRLADKGLERELSAILEQEFPLVAKKLKKGKKTIEPPNASAKVDTQSGEKQNDLNAGRVRYTLNTIPALADSDHEWILQEEAAKITDYTLGYLQNMRSADDRSAERADDKCSGIDPLGQAWRKKRPRDHQVYYLKSALSGKHFPLTRH